MPGLHLAAHAVAPRASSVALAEALDCAFAPPTCLPHGRQVEYDEDSPCKQKAGADWDDRMCQKQCAKRNGQMNAGTHCVSTHEKCDQQCVDCPCQAPMAPIS